ncbi:MAG TPA: hypothetical protein VD907_07045 [Verrucomicrobiae bacterium]|nr:hypothetical protein [Verrucomicrobiae bacterium]
MAEKKRKRQTQAGFIGVNLAKGGDMTIFNRLEKEVQSDPELDRSKVVRLALKEYFERRDAQGQEEFKKKVQKELNK